MPGLRAAFFFRVWQTSSRKITSGTQCRLWRVGRGDFTRSLHYVRDVSFNVDRSRVRAGARALAAIRSLVLHLIRSRGLSVPEARENFREDRAEAIALIMGRIL